MGDLARLYMACTVFHALPVHGGVLDQPRWLMEQLMLFHAGYVSSKAEAKRKALEKAERDMERKRRVRR